MKIGLQSAIPHYKSTVDTKYQSAAALTAPRSSKSFDELTIHAEQETSPEQQFAAALTSRVSMELRQPVSASRIQELQQMIDHGTYQVDVNTIADKIMLY